MATKSLDFVLRWKQDQASLNAAVAGTQKVETGIEQLVSAAKRGELSVDELRLALRAVGQGDSEIDKITASLKEAEAAAEGLDTTLTSVVTKEGRTLLRGEREEGRFQSFSLGTLGSIPGLGGSDAFGAASAAFELVDALPNLGFAFDTIKNSVIENVQAIGVSGVGLIGGLGLVLAGTKLLTDEYNRNYEASTRILDAQADYFRLIQTGTTETIAEQRATLEQQLATARGNRDLLQAQSDAINADLRARFGDAQILNEVAISFGLIGGEVAALRGKLTDANADVAALEKQITDLGVAANSTEVALNTAAADFKLLADTQITAAQRSFEFESLTKDQREERIAQLGREVEFYYDLIQSGVLVGDAVLQAQAYVEGLVGQMTELGDISQTYADVLAGEEARKKALTDQTDAYFAALDTEAKIKDKLAEITQQIADVESERAAKILEAQQDRDEKLQQLLLDLTDKRGELLVEGEQKRIEIIADSNARIARIERDSGRTLANLRAQRDALAYYLQAQQASDRIADEKEATDKSLDQQKKAQDKALAAAQKSYDQNYQNAVRAYDKQNRAAYDAANQRLNTLYNSQRAEQVALQNQQLALQNIALYGSNGQRIIHTQMWNDLGQLAVVGAQNFIGAFMGALQGGGSSRYPPLTGIGPASLRTLAQQEALNVYGRTLEP